VEAKTGPYADGKNTFKIINHDKINTLNVKYYVNKGNNSAQI
jgi:hypothetical protein